MKVTAVKLRLVMAAMGRLETKKDRRFVPRARRFAPDSIPDTGMFRQNESYAPDGENMHGWAGGSSLAFFAIRF